MTRLIVLTELINPKKEISFSLSSISQHQSNYHNLVLKPRYSKPANLLTSLETPHPHSKSADRAGSSQPTS